MPPPALGCPSKVQWVSAPGPPQPSPYPCRDSGWRGCPSLPLRKANQEPLRLQIRHFGPLPTRLASAPPKHPYRRPPGPVAVANRLQRPCPTRNRPRRARTLRQPCAAVNSPDARTEPEERAGQAQTGPEAHMIFLLPFGIRERRCPAPPSAVPLFCRGLHGFPRPAGALLPATGHRFPPPGQSQMPCHWPPPGREDRPRPAPP